MWYDADEANRLFRETLARLEPYLRSVDFRGNMDINCIVNDEGVFPLEVTARFGYPACQLQAEIHVSPWGEFLKAVADGRDYDLQWRRGYGLVALVATPPFPDLSPRGLRLRFHRQPTETDWNHLHLEEVSRNGGEDGAPDYVVAGDTGCVLHVSAFGEEIEAARGTLYARLGNIVLPRMFYRTDLGMGFIERDLAKLKKWGYL
jgi:phosphoribosylamine--glycine ligase